MMQRLFDEVASLDTRCYEKFGLTEDILMEHAANGVAQYIRDNFPKNSKLIIACGSGNNGADGLVVARLLHVDYDVSVFYAKKPKSHMALLQQKRVESLNIPECPKLTNCDVLVDAVLGTGFSGELNQEMSNIMKNLNDLDTFKIACDIPSGLKQNGECVDDTFVADISLTMGALKKSMYLDMAKDFVGKIQVIDLGLSREIYELESNWKLLDLDDLKLPFRGLKNSHKGSFGHLALACGEKSGASIMSAKAALRFGSGLVTLIGFEDITIPHSIMYSHELPQSTTALALGMGLGNEFSNIELDKFLDNDFPLIVDADIFHSEKIIEILERKNLVLTPHAKEFVSLLKLSAVADISVDELQRNRFKYVEQFCFKFKGVTLLLKGANTIIAKDDEFFINTHGTSVLAKGGSGDVLSGLIGALLAQGYGSFESAINASLTHTKLALNYSGTDFSLTPDDLIDGITKL